MSGARHRRSRSTAVPALLAALLTIDVSADDMAARLSAGNQEYWVEQIAEGLNFPSSLTWLPNGDLLIAEREGHLRAMRGGRLDPMPVSGTPPSYKSFYDGLKDIALDPDFSSTQRLFLFISEGSFEQHYAAVYRARYTAGGLKEVARIFRSKESVGGALVTITSRMMFLPDKTLLLGVTEDHAQSRAQRLDSQMGKILRIDRDGSIPQDNPFVNTPGALPEIWSYGHRVPLGLYWDAESGAIWEVESGPRGGDELNLLKPGANYGWAKTSWGFAYHNKGLEAPLQSAPGIEDPVLVWMPSVTPSGLTRCRGAVYPLWNGDYFLGRLNGKGLERLRIKEGRVVLQERMLLDLDERIRDIKLGPDRRLYLLTDNENGRVLRLQPGRPRAHQRRRIAHKLEQSFNPAQAAGSTPDGDEQIENLGPDDLAQGRQAFLERCAACHGVGTTIQGGNIGPDLAGVYGRLMGRAPGFDYSTVMAGGLIPWKFTRLDRFLANPGSVAPGTRMAAPPVTDAAMRRNIIGFLKQQSTQ